MTQWNTVQVSAIQTKDEITRLVASVRDSGENAVDFDLSEVERISTMTAQAILACANSCKNSGKGFRVSNITEAAKRSFDLIGIDEPLMTSTTV